MRCIPFNPPKLLTIKKLPQKNMMFCLSHLIAQELQALQSHARCPCVGNESSTVGNKSKIKKNYPKNYHKSKPIKKPWSRLEKKIEQKGLLRGLKINWNNNKAYTSIACVQIQWRHNTLCSKYWRVQFFISLVYTFRL